MSWNTHLSQHNTFIVSKPKMDLIHDEDQINRFLSILSPLKPNEVYCLSMYARGKYLEEDEKIILKNQREKINHKIFKPNDSYVNLVKSMQGVFFSKKGEQIPNKCIVFYAFINPSSVLKALRKFNVELTNKIFDFHLNEKSDTNFIDFDSKLMSYYQQEKSNRTFIDIDFDIPPEGYYILEKFVEKLVEKNVVFYTIQTKNGYHVLLKKESLSFNYISLVNEADLYAKIRFGTAVEVIINNAGSVPLPGTIQAGFNVHFVDDLSYQSL